MANMQQPSPRTCYIDIKQFAIIDWVEQEQDQCVHSSQGYISATWRYIPVKAYIAHTKHSSTVSLYHVQNCGVVKSVHAGRLLANG